MTESALVYLAGATAAFLVGLSKGGLSMAGALGVPLLALVISPVKAAAVLLPVFVVSDLVALWFYRRDFSRENLEILIPAGCAGIAVGWATASFVSERWVGFLVGLIGLGFCMNAWRQRHRPPVARPADLGRGIVWGTIMGFTSFVSHAGAPPYQVYVLPQRLPKVVFAGTSAIVFAVINAVKLLPYWALGQFSAGNLVLATWLAVPALFGTAVGVRLVRVLPQRRYFGIVMLLLFVVSVRLVTQAIAG